MGRNSLEEAGPPGSTDRLLVALVAGAVVVGAVAMAASAATLAELGHAVGWVQKWGAIEMSWSLPVAVDALALVAGAVWLTPRMSKQARSLARTVTLAAVLGSVGLNALGHLVQSKDVEVTSWLRIGVSTVPPLVAAVVVHLVGVVLTTRHHTSAEPDEPADNEHLAQKAGPAPQRPAEPAGLPARETEQPEVHDLTPVTPVPAADPVPALQPVAPVVSGPQTGENVPQARTGADNGPAVVPTADRPASAPLPSSEPWTTDSAAFARPAEPATAAPRQAAPVSVAAARTAPARVTARVEPEHQEQPPTKPAGPVKDWNLPGLPADVRPGVDPVMLTDEQSRARIRYGLSQEWTQRRIGEFAGRSATTVNKVKASTESNT